MQSLAGFSFVENNGDGRLIDGLMVAGCDASYVVCSYYTNLVHTTFIKVHEQVFRTHALSLTTVLSLILHGTE